MARKPQTNPRKRPLQERSRLTVDALLEATTRILVKEGYDQASTNKIAAVAGVSIGSLYQYFPSKEALVAAVVDGHMGEYPDEDDPYIHRRSSRSPVDSKGLAATGACGDAQRLALNRSSKNPDDVNSESEDHVFDAVKYAAGGSKPALYDSPTAIVVSTFVGEGYIA